ncbi:MAG: hypothetical protein ACR2HF_09950 [Methylococcaceae bacterium]
MGEGLGGTGYFGQAERGGGFTDERGGDFVRVKGQPYSKESHHDDKDSQGD